MILASQMAQRSFSIPEITELYLAYDAGQSGATIQKMSRVLTPGSDPQKVGKIISLSFDPNRDDKFDSLVLETTKNLRVKYPSKTSSELMAMVLSTLDIWKGGAHAGMRVNKDEFLKEAISRKNVSKVIGNVADLNKLNKTEIQALAQGHIQYSRVQTVSHVPKGKTKQLHKKVKNHSGAKDSQVKMQQLARERIVAVSENTDVILSYTACDQILDAVAVCDADSEIQQLIEMEFGLSWSMVRKLYVDHVINFDLLNLTMTQG